MRNHQKKHIQILKIEVETGNGFLAAETYSFSLKNTWFQNIDYFFKLTLDDPLPLAKYISWYMFMKKIFSHVSFLQNDKIFDFYVFILKFCKNKTKFQSRWRCWATQIQHNLMHLNLQSDARLFPLYSYAYIVEVVKKRAKRENMNYYNVYNF